MTPPRKANHNSHSRPPIVFVGEKSATIYVACVTQLCRARAVILDRVTVLQHSPFVAPQFLTVSGIGTEQAASTTAATIAAAAPRDTRAALRQSRLASCSSDLVSSCCVGVSLWEPNHQTHAVSGRPVSNGEHLFPTVHQITETPLPLLFARSGRARRQPSLRSARTSPSAAPNSGSPAIETRPSTRSWSFSMRCGRASGRDWSAA